MIEIEKLNYNYKSNNFELKNINLKINDGEFVCIIGKNGSGKSTFSKLVAGLTNFKSGTILINNIDLKNIRKAKTSIEIRKNVGIVFQNPETQILFDKVFDDMAFGLQNLGFSNKQIKEKIEMALKKVNMLDFINSKTDELSLGQKQRIAIASVLAIEPKILILDEPTTMLDPLNKNAIYKSLQKLHKNGTTIIYITNNIDEILLSDRILVLENGELKRDFLKKDLSENFDVLADFEVPGILSLIKKSILENKTISLENLLNIYNS